ncbi:choice-of-anchor J domain-containing protein [bacterium]|nr:choice-of-anchor J domain-containing protein [bacterium]
MKSGIILLCIMVVMLPGSFVSAQWHIQEDFDGGTVPPTGWMEYQLEDGIIGWDAGYVGHPNVTTTSYGGPATAHSGTYFAFHNDESTGNGCDSWIVTPAFTYAAGDQLVFWQDNAWIDYDYYELHAVMISTGSGDPNDGQFVQIAEYPVNLTEWVEQSLDLSTYASPGDVCYIAFRYMGDWESEWYVDDVAIGQNLWVDLLSFSAKQVPQGVELTWETAAEVDSLGFNVLRENIKNQGGLQILEVVNAALIPSQGTAHSGATYNLIDSQVYPKTRYRYYLEEIGQDSKGSILADVEINVGKTSALKN